MAVYVMLASHIIIKKLRKYDIVSSELLTIHCLEPMVDNIVNIYISFLKINRSILYKVLVIKDLYDLPESIATVAILNINNMMKIDNSLVKRK